MELNQCNDALIRVAESIVRERLGAAYFAPNLDVLTMLRAAQREALAQKIWHDAVMLADVVEDRLADVMLDTAAETPASLLASAVPPPATVTVTFTHAEWDAAVDAVGMASARGPDRALALLLASVVEKMQSGHIVAARAAALTFAPSLG